ncbi:MAG: hypothetical protein ACYC5Y_03670 [Symbiobacteriia bacterium]
MNRKLITLFAVLALTALVVAGCSSAPASTVPAPAAKPTIGLTTEVSADKTTVTFTGTLKNDSDKDIQNFRVLELRPVSAFSSLMAKAEVTQEPKIDDVSKQVLKAKSELKITWTYKLAAAMKDEDTKAYVGSSFSVLYKDANGELTGLAAQAK